MKFHLKPSDRVGLLHPSVDAHTLGVASVSTILADCGIQSFIAGAEACRAAMELGLMGEQIVLREWIRQNRLSVVGYSYRLDPVDAVSFLKHFLHFLHSHRLWLGQGGTVQAVFFAGLPAACDAVRTKCPEVAGVFYGDESPGETLGILGLPAAFHPASLKEGIVYDDSRLAFGHDLIRSGSHLGTVAPDRGGYPGFGTKADSLVKRVDHCRASGALPLLRAHVGPFSHDQAEAVHKFLGWTKELAAGGFLDVLSIGTSQLSQSDFFGDWTGKSDGGGVPIHTPEEFARVWEAARPMLVRSYAGTRDVPRMARMLEENLHIAWHALSLWWFCRIDGRGENSVLQNLREHVQALRYIAQTEKPFEANVPHHFAFRGSDDVSYVVSAYVLAKLAKANGIRVFILQLMLNTPKSTWGIQDLAKARATIAMVKGLEDSSFRVLVQTRGGLDYFSHKEDRAKAQLAAVTALMDDIAPGNSLSPDLIHVVSYSEGFALADPGVVKESLQITLQALSEYRAMRLRGDIPDMAKNAEVNGRFLQLMEDSKALVSSIERSIVNPYTAEGLYGILSAGYFPVPYLWQCGEEFPKAVNWTTRSLRGAVSVVDANGGPIPCAKRVELIELGLKGLNHG